MAKSHLLPRFRRLVGDSGGDGIALREQKTESDILLFRISQKEYVFEQWVIDEDPVVLNKVMEVS